MPPKYIKKVVHNIIPQALIPYLRRIENSDLKSRLVSGIFWSMLGAFISRGLMFFSTALVARMLGSTIYGELGIIQSTIGMLGIFAGFGVGLTAIKHVAEFRQSDPERAGRIVAICGLFATGAGGLMSIGLLIFAPWLAENTMNAPHLTGVLKVAALILFINTINGAQTGALSGFEAYKTIARVNLLTGITSFPILVCGAYFGDLLGVVWGLVINLCFNWLLNHLALRKEARRCTVPLTYNGCLSEWRVLLGFNLPITLASILVGPARWAALALLARQPDGYGELGIYTAALAFQKILQVVSGTINGPILSMMSNIGTKGSKRVGSINILSNWLMVSAVAVPFLCVPEMAEVVFGEGYAGYTFRVTLSMSLFCACIVAYRAGLRRSMIARGLMWWGFFNNLLWATILIPLVFYFVEWGAIGLTVSFAIAYIIVALAFLPTFISLAKVPRYLLLSKESGLIWLVTVCLTAMSFVETSLTLRLLIMPASIFVMGWAFIRLWRRSEVIQA